jgi:tRNA (guanosine-2'-O-)-methyltransferase
MKTPPEPASQLMVDGAQYPVTGIIEALEPYLLEERALRMREALDRRLGGVVLGVEDLFKTHNGAACLRTAEGLGLQNVAAVECRNAYPLPDETDGVHRKVTAHADRWVDLHHFETPDLMLLWARARGMSVFGAGPRGRMTAAELPDDRPALLLFGNEREGLRPETLDACDDTFRIPMYGFTESFNVSVSVGMVLGPLVERVRRRLAHLGRQGDLDAATRDWLLARWYVRDVRASEMVLRRRLGDLE